MSESAPDVSVVIPVYNEEEALPHLREALVEALASCGFAWEVILVNDGSRDGSAAVMDEIASRDARFVAIHFRRNYGQTAAMQAGFDAARGETIVALDADLQNDPRDIPRLVEALGEEYDVVSGWRKDRQDGKLTRRLPSRIANGLISRVTGVRLHDCGCSLKAYRAEVLRDVRLYGEMHRFIPALAHGAGARVTELPVAHHPRRHGESKYGLSRTFRVILDLMTVKFLLDYSTRPLQLFGRWGLWLGGAGLLLVLAALAAWLRWDVPLADPPLLVLGAVLGVGGLQLISVGLGCELLARAYHESRGKSIYAICRVTRLSAEPEVAQEG